MMMIIQLTASDHLRYFKLINEPSFASFSGDLVRNNFLKSLKLLDGYWMMLLLLFGQFSWMKKFKITIITIMKVSFFFDANGESISGECNLEHSNLFGWRCVKTVYHIASRWERSEKKENNIKFMLEWLAQISVHWCWLKKIEKSKEFHSSGWDFYQPIVDVSIHNRFVRNGSSFLKCSKEVELWMKILLC